MMFSAKHGLCLLMLFYLVVFECKCEGFEAVPKCASVECPSYTVIDVGKEFEIRRYNEALWVSSPTFLFDSILGAFDYGSNTYLTYYLYGFNSLNVKFNETAPTLVDVLGFEYREYNYLPQKYQNGSAPKPNDPEITFVKLPKHKFAVARRFINYLSDHNIAGQIDALKRSLQGTAYQWVAAIDAFSLALYNDPAEPKDQYYEVLIWFD